MASFSHCEAFRPKQSQKEKRLLRLRQLTDPRNDGSGGKVTLPRLPADYNCHPEWPICHPEEWNDEGSLANASIFLRQAERFFASLRMTGGSEWQGMEQSTLPPLPAHRKGRTYIVTAKPNVIPDPVSSTGQALIGNPCLFSGSLPSQGWQSLENTK